MIIIDIDWYQNSIIIVVVAVLFTAIAVLLFRQRPQSRDFRPPAVVFCGAARPLPSCAAVFSPVTVAPARRPTQRPTRCHSRREPSETCVTRARRRRQTAAAIKQVGLFPPFPVCVCVCVCVCVRSGGVLAARLGETPLPQRANRASAWDTVSSRLLLWRGAVDKRSRAGLGYMLVVQSHSPG